MDVWDRNDDLWNLNHFSQIFDKDSDFMIEYKLN